MNTKLKYQKSSKNKKKLRYPQMQKMLKKLKNRN